MGKDSKLLPDYQRLAVSSLKSNVLENCLGGMSFVPCALSCDCGPEPHINTGVIMEGNDVKRFTAQSQALPKDKSQRCCLLFLPQH